MARGRSTMGKRQRDDAPQVEATGTSNAEVSAPSVAAAPPPEYHFIARKTINTVLRDPEFVELCNQHGNVKMTTETVLESVCTACDEAAADPSDGPSVSLDTLAQAVYRHVQPTCSSTAVVEAFASAFSQRMISSLPKVTAAERSRMNSRGVGARGRGRGRGPHESSSGLQEQQDPRHGSEDGGLFPSPPLVNNEGSIFDAPPPMAMYQNSGPLFHGQPPMLVPSAAGLLQPPPMMFPPFHAPPPSPPLVPVAPSTVRCVTLDNVPYHFLSAEAMRPQLTHICGRLRNVYFYNTHVMEGTSSVVVSLNSCEAATEVITRVNYTSQVDGGPITARSSTAAEMEALLAPLRERVRSVEAATMERLAAYDEQSAGCLRAKWHAAREAMLRVDGELDQLAAATNDAAQKERKLELLREKLAASKIQAECVGRLQALSQPLDGPVDGCTSSTATIGNGASVLYISNLPPNMPDQKFLIFFEPLRQFGSLVHVWRDPRCPTRVCCAMLGAGEVFAVLRYLDGCDWTFCGASFSKFRPRD